MPPPFLAHQDQEGWLPAGLAVVAWGYLSLAASITKKAHFLMMMWYF